ncbi:recombination-associated protein RdgC [Xenophilus arseniciresistens]|uniref:Recombination-associated protein RdgC n=1 Tax=Xenophilus arseniciresistens TaxID=1283306 RepID=A0AAE3T0P9_9BURK|nr:recombination-associated protein RdgC [Xenophilus arseniciresistens]MDA7418339.1 recombination-associated protein RdgC [Xenophilus arseniciresistens]
MPRFKNALAYRLEPSWVPDFNAAQDALDAQRFAPCGPSQESSAGFVAPRGQEHGLLLESVGGQWLLEYMVESKTVPASVIRRKVDERAAEIEKTTGRAPGKKEKKQLKEDVTHELLPLAFTRHARISVWIDPEARRLTLDTSNAARADGVVTALVQALPGFAVAPFHTQQEPASAMAGWLASYEPPAGFSIDRDCELKASDESKAVVRYAKHPLDIEEVRQHIEAGKRPTRLAMTWEDRVSFELTEGFTLRKLAFLEGVLDDAGVGGDAKKGEENFDTDAAIVTGELRQLLPALLEALGGEMQLGQAAAAPRDASPAAPKAAQAKAAAAVVEAADDDPPF